MSSLARRKQSLNRLSKAQLIEKLDELMAEERQLGDRLVESSPDFISFVDTNYIYRRVNPAYERVFQLPASQIVGRHITQLLDRDFFEEIVKPRLDRAFAGDDIRFETWSDFETIGRRFCAVTYAPLRMADGHISGVMVTTRDITEKRRAEEALVASEAKFRDLIEGSIQGVMIYQAGKIVYCNTSYAEIHGYKVSEMMGMDVDSRVAPDEMDRVRKYRSLERISVPEFRGLRKDGSIVWLSASARTIDWDGKPARQVTTIDISDSKRAEQALRRQAVILEQLNDAVVITDMERGVIDCNRAAENLFGYSRRELLGLASSKLVVDQKAHEQRVVGMLREVEESGRWVGEVQVPHVSGKTIYCELALAPLFDDDGARSATIGVLRDITQRKQAEEAARRHAEELSQVLRRNTMGEMTSALAHELNQPLASIANYCRGCLRRLKSGKANPEDLIEVIEKASLQAERAGAIIRQIGDFVRGAEPRRTRLDINDIIRDIAPIAEAEASQVRVRIDLNLAAGLDPVFTQPIEIQHVILNLLRNGIEAVTNENGGARDVSVSTSQGDNGTIDVRIRDTGVGIPECDLGRIFEPFFTTKPKGMGMGLAISRSIVERHGGSLRAYPNHPRGTTFQFHLPVAKEVPLNA